MQSFTESNKKISRNTNENNYNNRIMWMRMISDDDMSTTSFTTKYDKKLFIIEQKNRMKIVCAIMKQKWLKTLKTWQFILNNLLQERLHDIQIKKTRKILFSSIKKIS